MNIQFSIAAIPPSPRAGTLTSGQAFQVSPYLGEDAPVCMVVEPWGVLRERIGENLVYVNLATGEMHQMSETGKNNTRVKILHAEVLVA